jgi:RNA recognition motif-containing protein
MAKKLYVGGLSYDTTDDSLKTKFSEAGTVASASVVMDKMSGRSRGFGFVEFDNDADADKAIEMFNEKEFEGRRITVNVARPREDRPQGGGGRGGFGGGGGRW